MSIKIRYCIFRHDKHLPSHHIKYVRASSIWSDQNMQNMQNKFKIRLYPYNIHNAQKTFAQYTVYKGRKYLNEQSNILPTSSYMLINETMATNILSFHPSNHNYRYVLHEIPISQYL